MVYSSKQNKSKVLTKFQVLNCQDNLFINDDTIQKLIKSNQRFALKLYAVIKLLFISN